MFGSLEDRLRMQARKVGDDGDRYHGPDAEPSLEDFQRDFRTVEQYESEGLLKIIGRPHREGTSGHNYVDMFRVQLTGEGVKRWGGKA
jgi:hypothetical protein